LCTEGNGDTKGRGKRRQGEHNSPGAQSLWGCHITAGDAEKSQKCQKYFIQHRTFASERPRFQKWGRQTCFLPRASSNLVTSLIIGHLLHISRPTVHARQVQKRFRFLFYCLDKHILPYSLLRICAVKQTMLWDSLHRHNVNNVMYDISNLTWFLDLLGVKPVELSEVVENHDVFVDLLGLQPPRPSRKEKRVWKWIWNFIWVLQSVSLWCYTSNAKKIYTSNQTAEMLANTRMKCICNKQKRSTSWSTRSVL